LLLFALGWWLQGDERGYWLPGLGVGVTLLAWFGWRALGPLAGTLLLVRCLTHTAEGSLLIFAGSFFHILHIAAGWWLYHVVARGSRGLDDPRSATIFLLFIPGILSIVLALVQALVYDSWQGNLSLFWLDASQLLLGRMVGMVVIAPLLIVVGTPVLLRYRLVDLDWPPAFFGRKEQSAAFGDNLELAGLTFATTLLALLLLWSDAVQNVVLWGGCLILIVWACIRQGLRGGSFCASVTSIVVVIVAQILSTPDFGRDTIQGHVLAFCSTALLLGVSVNWIRANESRYREVVDRVPFVLYSARLTTGIPALIDANQASLTKTPVVKGGLGGGARLDFSGASIGKLAKIVLVSPACRAVFGCDEAALLGSFSQWLEQIEPGDREIVFASLAQLCLQKQPVTCEFRLRIPPNDGSPSTSHRLPTASTHRWLRDTLTPHYNADGELDGWEGLVEEITEQRALSHNLRKTSNMLQVLVGNLPMGVYFVQGPAGYPLLVNARARQLLGKREDLSCGLEHLSNVFRLARPDGSEYPWQDLPVSKAMRQGATCRANDIVVTRPDGRKIPLISWAAPIDLHNTGVPDAAVWVLEDWTTLQQAELAARESEVRLRAVIETMGEGVIVQDAAGGVLDCNEAACTILGISREAMMRRIGLTQGATCVQEDGNSFPPDQQPDQLALRAHKAIRGVILGLGSAAGEVHWLLVNSLPLAGANQQKARVVTTFADITSQVHAQHSLRMALDKYQKLVEHLPFMLYQRDLQLNMTYLNPAATQVTGYSAQELMSPGFCASILHKDDVATFHSTMETVHQGKSSRIEVRYRTKDKSLKHVFVFIHPNFEDGVVVGSTSLIVDITMQRRLEQELQQAKHLELVGRLASGTVHDFNNLLTVLMGLAGLARYEIPADHSAQKYLSRIEEAGEQASHLAGQLLTFSKQRSKQYHAVDLNLVVTQTLKLVQSVMPLEIDLESKLDPLDPKVHSDENSLKQVLMNLCLNARDAMPNGGTICVQTDTVTPPRDESATENCAWVHLSITDQGVGMATDMLGRIFEPFYSTKENGTGLGLSVVQQIIKESGGIIEVHSKPNEGTRFDIWLKKE